jgi:hypothetical protein
VRRGLFNLLTVLSILVFVAVSGFGALSMSRAVGATLWESPASAVAVGVHRGGVYVLMSSPRAGWRGAVPRVLDDWTVNLGGFKVGPELPPGHWPGAPSFVVVPSWFLMLVFGGCGIVCRQVARRRSDAAAREPEWVRKVSGALLIFGVTCIALTTLMVAAAWGWTLCQ